jgi:hypothetical protein
MERILYKRHSRNLLNVFTILNYFRLNRKWKVEHPPFTPTCMNLKTHDFPSKFQRILTDQAIEWTHNV